ncbi:MAG: protein kinase [Candidatus Dormiibacterota bacterium]
MGSLRRRGRHTRSTSNARGFTPLGDVESDGSGLLIAARSQFTHALVDVRILAATLKGDRARMRQLRGEMDVLREVRHTNLVSVMDFDKRAGAVVYESVPGSSLTDLLDGQGPIELAAGLVLLEDCVSGLEALHNVGVIHRNVTPDSVVIESTGAVLLRDTGLSPTVSPPVMPSEPSRFLAPEVAAGGPPTRSSDLYGATAVFLESIGGRASKPGMRVDLRPLLGEGMAKDPSARSETLGAFRRELDDYARATFGEGWRKEGRALLVAAAAGQASRSIRVSSPAEPPSEGADEALSAVALLRSRGSRSPRSLPMLGAFGLVALVVVLILVRGFSSPQGFSPILHIFNGIPVLGALSSPTPTPTAAAVAPATSAGPYINPATGLPITSASPTANGAGGPTPKPGSNPTPPPLISQAVRFTTQSPTGEVYSGSYLVGATGGASGNPVLFSSLTGTVCKLGVGNTFDFVGVGTCTILASQQGNARYSAGTASMSFTVGQASQTISFTTSPSNPTYNDAPYTVHASAAGGPVTFSADPASVACSVSPTGTVTFTAAGECIIDANQGGSADYSAAQTRQQPFNVAQASQTVNPTSSPPCNPCATLTTYTLSGTASSGLAVTFGIDGSSTPGSCSISGNQVTINGGPEFPGTCVIDFFQNGDQDYSAAAVQTQSVTVIT